MAFGSECGLSVDDSLRVAFGKCLCVSCGVRFSRVSLARSLVDPAVCCFAIVGMNWGSVRRFKDMLWKNKWWLVIIGKIESCRNGQRIGYEGSDSGADSGES
mgnify:CR=1 FL=1